MRSISVLKKQTKKLSENIKTLLDNCRYEETVDTRLNVITKITSLREELATLQRELRERQAA